MGGGERAALSVEHSTLHRVNAQFSTGLDKGEIDGLK